MSHEIGNVRGQSRASGRRERRAAGLELRQRALRSRVGPGSSWHRPAAATLAAAGRGERGASRSCGRRRAVLPGTGRQVRAGREEDLGAAVGSLSPGTQTLSRQGAISERGDPKLPILRQNTGRGLSVACPEGPCPTAAPARLGSSVLISAGGALRSLLPLSATLCGLRGTPSEALSGHCLKLRTNTFPFSLPPS